MVATATRTILENLDRIPDEGERTKIAIICYDVSLYFFSLPVSLPILSIYQSSPDFFCSLEPRSPRC